MPIDKRHRRCSPLVTLALIAATALLSACASSGGGTGGTSGAGTTQSQSSSVSTPAPATTSPAVASSYPCTWTPDGTAAKKVSVPSTTTPPKTGTVVVAVGTTQGSMTFTLNRTAAPCTVASFVSLVQQKYYDKTPCHRLTTAGIYVLQCGDPTGTGMGGPGYTIPDEFHSTDTFTTGVLAMANTGQPDTGGSQFFIVYKDTSLPPQYTIFGKVTAGLSVVDKVAAKGSDNSNGTGDGHPKLPISFTTLTVAK